MRLRLVLPIAALLVAAALPAGASALDRDARYALVHGCYDLTSGGKKVAGPLRMQASGLGTYLLYGAQGDFLTAGADGKVAPAADPSDNGNWTVDVRGDDYTLTLPNGKALSADAAGALTVGGGAGAFGFAKADGCATFPEAPTNVTGDPSTVPTPYGAVKGILDAHMHWMAFEFLGGKAHCGRPWSPFGIADALVDCPSHRVPGSEGNLLELALGGPATHDPQGWPNFTYWPKYNSLTHEGTYYKWVERAYRSGLRMFVNLYVDNGQLCNLYTERSHNCNEMDTVRLEMKRLRETRDYIDAQEGGPGKGWLKIVTDPFEARKVIASGKLAVLQGIEISRLFDCQVYNDVPQCDKAKIDKNLDEMYNGGVRAMELVNKFDNAFVGVAGDTGTTGLITNTGNKLETGKYLDMQTCQGLDPGEEDQAQVTVTPAINNVLAPLYGAALPQGQAPVYPPPPHCNSLGLSSLGQYLIGRMMDKGMIIDPDHMSVAARNATLDLVEARKYGGLVSSHSWSTPEAYKRILQDGGVVTPIASSAKSFAESWKTLKAERNPNYLFGFGYGADMNGFHSLGGPANDPAATVTYPFKSIDGKQTIDKETTGNRTWDINTDGTDHYGLLPDWIESVHKLAGDDFMADMANGPEAYLQMWERALGVPMHRKLPARTRFTTKGLGKVLLGSSNEALLRSAGQPFDRGPRAWTYDVSARDKRPAGKVVAVLTPEGSAGLVASTGPEHVAAAAGAGDKLPKGAKRVASGLYVKAIAKGGPKRYVYGVKKGRITFAGVATGVVAKTAASLKAYVKLAAL